MNVSYESIGHQSVTFPKGNCTLGYPCKINISGYASNASAGEKFVGVAECDSNNRVAVQVAGFVTLPYSGTKPSCGYVKLTANGQGGVKVDDTGLGYWVAAVDSVKAVLTVKL